MAFWLLRGLLRGVVTTRYPAELDAWASELPTPPEFRPAELTPSLAAYLVELCPSHALSVDGFHMTFDVGACSACGRCSMAAPQACVPSGVFGLATLRRQHLIKSIPLEASDD